MIDADRMRMQGSIRVARHAGKKLLVINYTA
nr:MAG TPA: hypothetical protein [Caudoviricetes sp.]